MQLTRDPPVPPPRVLASEPQNQLANLPADPRAPGTPSWIRPAARDEPAVPRQQRFRGHEERTPARPREQPARRGQESTVRRPKCRARYLPAQAPRSRGAGRRSQAPCIQRSESTATRAPSSAQHHVQATTPAPAPPSGRQSQRHYGLDQPQNACANEHDRVYAPHTRCSPAWNATARLRQGVARSDRTSTSTDARRGGHSARVRRRGSGLGLHEPTLAL